MATKEPKRVTDVTLEKLVSDMLKAMDTVYTAAELVRDFVVAHHPSESSSARPDKSSKKPAAVEEEPEDEEEEEEAEVDDDDEEEDDVDDDDDDEDGEEEEPEDEEEDVEFASLSDLEIGSQIQLMHNHKPYVGTVKKVTDAYAFIAVKGNKGLTKRWTEDDLADAEAVILEDE